MNENEVERPSNVRNSSLVLPKKVASQVQGADRGARRVPLCWWHGNGCSDRKEDAKRCRSSIWLLWQLPYDLTISIKKTEVVYQPAPGKPYKEPTIVQHLADYVVVFGIEVESSLTQSWKSTKLWCCQHYCMHAKRGQFTNGMPKDWTTSIQAALESF